VILRARTMQAYPFLNRVRGYKSRKSSSVNSLPVPALLYPLSFLGKEAGTKKRVQLCC
jgi:hypothetical protein